EHATVSASVSGDRIDTVVFQEASTGEAVTVIARLVLDASETGELISAAGVEHVTGFESRNETGEADAPEVAQPMNMQAASWCFAVEHRAGEDHTIDRPADYDD